MEGHRDIKIERIIIGHTGHEEHQDQKEVVLEPDMPLFGAEFLRDHESLECHKGKLAERDEVSRARIMSRKIITFIEGSFDLF